MNTKKKILILGSNGFVGKNLLSKLIIDNYETIGVNKTECNLLNKSLLSNKINEIKPDIIINCAGRIGSSEQNKTLNQFTIYNENIQMMLNLLDVVKHFNFISKIYFFSSYRSYDDCFNLLKSEKITMHKNRGYLLGKMHLHGLLELFSQQSLIKVYNFIIPNLYGDYDTFKLESRIVPSLIYQLHEMKINNIKKWQKKISAVDLNLLSIEELVVDLKESIITSEYNNIHYIVDKKNIISLKSLITLLTQIIYPNLELQFIYEITNNEEIEDLNIEDKKIKDLIKNLESLYEYYKISNGIL